MRAYALFWLAFLAAGNAASQEVQLYERDAPSIGLLYNDRTGEFSGPPGNWNAYFQALHGGWTPKGGLVAAIIDSGVIRDHPLIAPVLVEALDLTGEGPDDQVGHGTFVTLQYLSVTGPAPIISIKIFGGRQGHDGAGRIEEALRIAATRGARIVNISAGVPLACANSRDPAPPTWLTPCEEMPLCRVVSDVKKAGVFIAAAVGNDPQKTGCPACCADAIAVGAAGTDGAPAPYSGRFPDILAPGNVAHVQIGRVNRP